MNYHAGNEINTYLKEHGISKVWLATKVNCDPGNFSRILKKPSMEMALLHAISVALNHNFGAGFSDDIDREIRERGEKTE